MNETLVLLSGLLCDETVWSDVVPLLGGDRPVKLISFPNFSSIESMAAHVLKTVSGTFAVAGHSMGGRVAIEVLRMAPARVTGIALLNTGIHPARPQETESRGRLVSLANESGMAALADEWLPPMMGDSSEVTAAVMPRLRKMVERSTPESFAGQIQALLKRPSTESALASIKVPTLLSSGTADKWSPVSQHQDMQRLIPGSRLVVIENAGHMALIEQPAAVSAALREWLAQVDAR